MRSDLRCVGTAALLLLGLAARLAAPAFGQNRNPEREAFFGETHVHTSWSLDAFSMGNTITTPADAYANYQLTQVVTELSPLGPGNRPRR